MFTKKVLKEIGLQIAIMVLGLFGAFLIAWTTEMFTPEGRIAFLSPIVGTFGLMLVLKPQLTPIALLGLWATVPVPFFGWQEGWWIAVVISVFAGSFTMQRLIKWFQLVEAGN